MTTPRTTTRRRAARKAKVAPKSAPAKDRRTEAGRLLVQERDNTVLNIPPHKLTFRRALLKRAWVALFPALGVFAALGLYGLVDPEIILGIVLVAFAAPIPLFVFSWGDTFMPVLVLELNEQKDRYRLRTYDALRGDYGSEGRIDIFGKYGYGVDALEPKPRTLAVFATPEGYETSSPEGIRYMCDHTPTIEKHRRRNKRLARDLIQWSAVTMIIGILAGMAYLIGNRL